MQVQRRILAARDDTHILALDHSRSLWSFEQPPLGAQAHEARSVPTAFVALHYPRYATHVPRLSWVALAAVPLVAGGATRACAARVWGALHGRPTREASAALSSSASLSSAVRAGAASTTESNAAPPPCPASMVLVEGDYCPEVVQHCLEWMDPPTSRYAHFRCAHYDHHPTCKKPRVHMRYCIDRTERTKVGETKPMNHVSFNGAKSLCAEMGAHVCRESEWQFACEGEEMLPYPYGYDRDETACNTDRTEDLGRIGRLVDHRTSSAEHPRCKSPFGVMDLSGNLEEWVAADGQKMGYRQVLKGSWWIPSRHACRSFQVGHRAVYQGTETGTRCCADARPSDAP